MKVRWFHMEAVQESAKGRIEQALTSLGEEVEAVEEVRIVVSEHTSHGAPETEVRLTGRVDRTDVSVSHRDRDLTQALNRAEEGFERAVRRRRARRRTVQRGRAVGGRRP